MFSLSQKTNLADTKLITPKREEGILRAFIEEYFALLGDRGGEMKRVDFIPQALLSEVSLATYTLTSGEFEKLWKDFEITLSQSQDRFALEEKGEGVFGSCLHTAHQKVGFYLGKARDYDRYWARFWLEAL